MVTYTFTNGTVANADEVNQNFKDVMTKVFADNTGGNHSSLGELDLATVTIPQNTMSSNFSVMCIAGIRMDDNNSANQGQTTFRLYVDGVVVKTIFLSGSTSTSLEDESTTFTWYGGNLDNSSGDKIIKISAENNPYSVSYCDGLLVQTYNN